MGRLRKDGVRQLKELTFGKFYEKVLANLQKLSKHFWKHLEIFGKSSYINVVTRAKYGNTPLGSQMEYFVWNVREVYLRIRFQVLDCKFKIWIKTPTHLLPPLDRQRKLKASHIRIIFSFVKIIMLRLLVFLSFYFEHFEANKWFWSVRSTQLAVALTMLKQILTFCPKLCLNLENCKKYFLNTGFTSLKWL